MQGVAQVSVVKQIKIRNMKSYPKYFFSRNLSRSQSVKELIIRETEIVDESLTPEIKLRLITKNCRLFHATTDELSKLPFADPFWGFYWPGGMSITRYILDHPDVVKNKKVLDFGSGCGATSIASKMMMCRDVVANDIDETATIAAELNADLNNVKIRTDTRNLINNPSTFQYEVITFGDVFYDEEFAAELLPWIMKLVANKQTCLIGDPGRHALSKKLKLKLLARYNLPDNVCIENHGFRCTNVFKVAS